MEVITVTETTLEPLAVSAQEAARLLDLSKPKVYELIHRGDFPAFRCGGRTLISVAGLRDWVHRQVQATQPAT